MLVHERMPTYAWNGDAYPPLQGYDPNSYWAGDQGLIMGSLKQFAHQTHAAPAGRLASWSASLLTGVFYNMPSNPEGAVGPPLLPRGAVGPYLVRSAGSPILGDTNDYGSGSGVFWRYVMRCCRLDTAFAELARHDPKIAAMAITSGTQPNEWGNSLFRPFNSVAAAIGAWYLLAGPAPRPTGGGEDPS
jgi:hypothetical protein